MAVSGCCCASSSRLLLRLLSSASVDCKLNACGALQNLCVHPNNKVEVAACGGIQVGAWRSQLQALFGGNV